MLKVILVLVYLLDGELKVEQKAFDTAMACMAEGARRTATLQAQSGFNEGLFAGCVHAKVVEARNEVK